jgi:hypothetical protein
MAGTIFDYAKQKADKAIEDDATGGSPPPPPDPMKMSSKGSFQWTKSNDLSQTAAKQRALVEALRKRGD